MQIIKQGYNPLSSPKSIYNITKHHKLKKVVIETGPINGYVPSEEKFIVKKDFLAQTPNLLKNLPFIEEVDLSNFDFKEIKILTNWFYGDTNLTKIIFPTNVYCPNLTSLAAAFSGTKLQILDLTNWYFRQEVVNIFGLVSGCSDLQILRLPKFRVSVLGLFVNSCVSLKELDFGEMEISKLRMNYFKNERSVKEKIFSKNYNLMLINCSNMRNTPEDIRFVLESMENLQDLPENCKIILPN